MLWFCFLIMHFVFCILIYFGMKKKILNVPKYIFPAVLFIPFWGEILILILHFQIGWKVDGTKKVGVEKMKIESDLYRSVAVDEKKISDTAVPMEEALLINSSQERRSLILDILHDNPKEYVEFLQKAGNNDDTEVVHYAVTAMVEISKENDDALHMLEREYAAHPENREILQTYTSFLWNCLSQNMMQGQVEQINRALFSDLMKNKMENSAEKEDFVQSITNELKRKNYTAALESLERMKVSYPTDEAYYLLKLQYLAAVGRGKEIKALLEEIKEKQIYISAKGKEVLAFWEK